MDQLEKIIIAFETKSLEEIRACFNNGVDPNMTHNGMPLVYELINMYSRGPVFKQCIQLFVDQGLIFEDKALLAVLLDNASMLNKHLGDDKQAIHRKYSFNCTFTPLSDVSLLHICAEYNHVSTAQVLIRHGADVNAVAGIDEDGFGGHTPIFHTVNQHANGSIDMLKLLLAQHVDLDITVKGLIWGKGYSWETFIPSVNPISYAMMGLLRQFQRREQDIYEVVSILMQARYGLHYSPTNIPNKYLSE
jgi:hypothetical protein